MSCQITSGLLFSCSRTTVSSVGTYISIQDCSILQEDLTCLGQREAYWQMKFNVAKCHSMRVTWHQHHRRILFDLIVPSQPTLENVQSAKYLAVIFLPALPASFAHNFVSGMQSFYFSESQDAMVLQTCHEK